MQEKPKKLSVFLIVLICLVATAAAVLLYIYVIGPACTYGKACSLRDGGHYLEAIDIFTSLEDYKDSADQVLLCRYKEADHLESEGRKAVAAMAFGALDDYSDAKQRSLDLWSTIAIRKTVDSKRHRIIGLRNDGTVVAYKREKLEDDDGDLIDYYPERVESSMQLSDIVDVSAAYFDFYAVKNNGSLYEFGNGATCHLVNEDWTDIVAVDSDGDITDGEIVLALRSDGTVVCQHSLKDHNRYGQENVSGWRNIVSVRCSTDISAGLRANGTVIATGNLDVDEKHTIEEWTDIVAIEVGRSFVLGLKADGTVVFAGNTFKEYADVTEWKNVVSLGSVSECSTAVTADGTVLFAGESRGYWSDCTSWTDIVAVMDAFDACYGLRSDGKLLITLRYEWFREEEVKNWWKNIKLPTVFAFRDLDPDITVDLEAEKGPAATNTPSASFTNEYGTPTTLCAHTGCTSYIASSGDTNCCVRHSNRCGNCRCYIDEDAMYCMKCLEDALS